MSFPRYPKYKASGVEWLGEVPEHWEVRATKRLFRILGGGTPASEVPDYWDGDIAWATPADLGKITGLELSTTQRRITAAGRDSCNTTVVPTGSILLSTRAPIGSVALAGAPICTNQGCKSLIPSVDAYSRFYAYTLLACTVPLQLRGKGTTFLELSGEELGAFPLVLPPLAEQRAIAAFLDRETKKIDELVAEQERLIELLKEKRQAVISHAVTKGLDPAAPMKPSGVEWLGDVPAHWKVVRLRYLVDCLDGVRVPLNAEERAQRPGEVPYWGANCVVDYVDVALVSEPVVLLGEDGAPFFDKSKQVAFHVTNPIWPNNHVHVLRPREYLVGQFLTAVLNATDFAAFIAGSTRDKLTQASMNAIPVPLPPLAEQRAIAAFLDRETAKIDTLVAQAESAISLLTERRSALISAAVTGQIDVRNAVPSANPTEAA
jgi:type I restriction enzyme S subunit